MDARDSAHHRAFRGIKYDQPILAHSHTWVRTGAQAPILLESDNDGNVETCVLPPQGRRRATSRRGIDRAMQPGTTVRELFMDSCLKRFLYMNNRDSRQLTACLPSPSGAFRHCDRRDASSRPHASNSRAYAVESRARPCHAMSSRPLGYPARLGYPNYTYVHHAHALRKSPEDGMVNSDHKPTIMRIFWCLEIPIFSASGRRTPRSRSVHLSSDSLIRVTHGLAQSLAHQLPRHRTGS